MHKPDPPLSDVRGRLLLLLAAVLWSTSGLFMKSPALATLETENRGPLLACYRALAAGLCLLPLVRWSNVRLHWRLIPMLVSFAAMNLLFVSAMIRTTAAVAIFLQYTATAWAFVFGAVFLKERMTRGNLVALACAMVGIVWIVNDQWAGAQFSGTLLALGSGVSYAGVIVSLRALRDEDTAWLVVVNHLVSGLLVLPWVLSLRLVPTPAQGMLILLLGVCQMAAPYFLFARGVRTVPAQEAGLITLLEAILNPLWVALFWPEPVSAATWIGGAWILGGLLLRYAVFNPRSPADRAT